MPNLCSRNDCYPDSTGCNDEGLANFRECPHYLGKGASNGAPTATKSDALMRRVPWTGSQMGLHDLNLLTARSKVFVVGIAGVAGAGKTTFLAALYCLLRKGAVVEGYQFAGSYTLNGWETLAWYLSWRSSNDIQFPPHTSSNAGRVPGLLHLALRDKNGNIQDVVFADAPGEWFRAWAVKEQDPNAAGARWVNRYANAFLLFADCEMLAGPELGKARHQLRQVGDRLKVGLKSRPLALVWAKADKEVSAEVRDSISSYLINGASEFDFATFETSVYLRRSGHWHQQILASVSWLLSTVNASPARKLPAVPRPKTDDLFFLKR